MTEEIKARQTNQEQSRVVGSGQDHTGGRDEDRKPMVSWAALLQEAVSKPGYIHEAYSRFHSYSLAVW